MNLHMRDLKYKFYDGLPSWIKDEISKGEGKH